MNLVTKGTPGGAIRRLVKSTRDPCARSLASLSPSGSSTLPVLVAFQNQRYSWNSSMTLDVLSVAILATGTTVTVASCLSHDEVASDPCCGTTKAILSNNGCCLAREEKELSTLATSATYVDPRAGIMYPHDTSPEVPESGGLGKSTRSMVPLDEPYDLSIRAARGRRQYMEDTYFVGPRGRFVAVFDGHGGSAVSAYLRDSLYKLVQQALKQKQWEESDDEILTTTVQGLPPSTSPSFEDLEGKGASVSAHVSALRTGFEQAEKNVLKETKWNFQGSTAVVVWIHETSTSDGAQRTLVSANVGDSRAVLSRNGKAIDLTHDHKPNEEHEKARILREGEFIEWDGLAKVHRVRSLSLSRSIGDSFAKPVVSPKVDIKLFPIVEGNDEFIVLASDGLWDVMESQQVVSYVNERLTSETSNFVANGNVSPQDIENFQLVLRNGMARSLTREAIRRGSGDNICVLIVWLK